MLDRDFVRLTSKIVERRESKDGTVKMLIRLQDGMEVETVVIPMSPGYSTVCVSSQVGCAMGCTFCATGMMGLKGSLTAGEIVEQLVHAHDCCPDRNVRNVVFMGMGEPLNNYENVLTSCRTFTDQKTFSLAGNSITVSTVGVVEGIRKLARDAPWVRLAFSLHSPEQDTRTEIIPSGHRYPLPTIIDAIDYFADKSKSKVMIEFTVLKGTNDSVDVASKMGQLLQGKNVVINLIPYNPTEVDQEFQVPEPEAIEAMWQILVKKHGLKCTIRQQHGVDIGGACGQLALQQTGGTLLPDIEDAASPSGRRAASIRPATPRTPRSYPNRPAVSATSVAPHAAASSLKRIAPLLICALVLLAALAASHLGVAAPAEL